MLARLLQVRRGESTRAILLFTYLFLIIASSVITKANRDALFQEKFGSFWLPYVDMASAAIVAAVMSVYLRVSRRVSPQSLQIGTLVVGAVATIEFWFVARVREPVWMLPVLYVWVSAAAVLLPAQVWTLANQVMTTREAKRLFGVVSGGAISGGIVGGFVTRAIANRSGTADLLLPTAAALAVCPVLVTAIWRERKRLAEAAGTPADPSRDDPGGIKESFALIWRSPHLRAVATLVCVSSLVTQVVGWQYKATAKLFYPDTDQLTAFYGTFAIWAGVLALATQLFLSSRLLRRFGLGVALLIVPMALTGGSLALLASGGLWAAVLLRGSDQVMRYSIDKSTAELLYLPIPARQLARAKALIDTVMLRVGDGLGAALLAISVAVLADRGNAREVGLAASRISVVTLVLLVGWIAAAISAKRHYVESLRDSIYEHRIDAEQLSTHIPDRSTTDVLAGALDAVDPREVLYALTLLENREPPVSHPAIGRLLGHASPEIRRKAISVLAAADDATALAQVEPLLRDENDDVRAEALMYLARCGNVDPLTQLTNLDDVRGGAVAAAVAHFLARPGPSQNLDAVRVLLEVATSSDGPDRHDARMEAARLIGTLPDQFEEQLNALLMDQSPDVVRLALRAAAAVGKPSSVPLVVAQLADANLSADATEALVAFGDRAMPALRQALGADAGATGVRHAIPDVLQRIGTPEAEQLLVEYLLDVDPVFRLRSVSALNKLRQQNGDRRLEHELVETLLSAEILGHYRSYQLLGRLSESDVASAPQRARVQASMDDEIERIFRLMKLLLPEHDLHSAYFGLRSGNAVAHANALEFLEHALPARLRTLLLPLIDGEVSVDGRIAIAERIVGTTVETSEQALAVFAASDELLRDEAQNPEGKPKTGSHKG